jgi:GNAT superfamily N-acetyltransferase
MPVVDDSARSTRRLLVDDAGATVATFELPGLDGQPRADVFAIADGVADERAVALVMTELRGWRVSGTAPFGRLLIAAGALPRRHAQLMSRDLTRDPAPSGWLEPALPPGIRIAPVDRPAADLTPAFRAAFPPDHPDRAELRDPANPEDDIEPLMSGRLMGPLLRCSALALDESAAVVGAILVNANSGDPPLEGPWIANLFRDPRARGVGTALLRRALAVATRDALPALGLAVTYANAARSLYAAHGFEVVGEFLNVDVP